MPDVNCIVKSVETDHVMLENLGTGGSFRWAPRQEIIEQCRDEFERCQAEGEEMVIGFMEHMGGYVG